MYGVWRKLAGSVAAAKALAAAHLFIINQCEENDSWQSKPEMKKKLISMKVTEKYQCLISTIISNMWRRKWLKTVAASHLRGEERRRRKQWRRKAPACRRKSA